MIKLYKLLPDGTFAYHEAWVDGAAVTEHWGAVGTRGESRSHALGSRKEARAIDEVLAAARAEGFDEIDEDDLATLLVEFRIEGMGTQADVERRHRLEDLLNETLGWTGLGHCDGGSIGAGTMEVCCFVVDVAIAKDVVARALEGTEHEGFSRIYEEQLDDPS